MIILIKFIYTNIYGYYLLYDYNVPRFIFNVWLVFRVRNSEKFQIKFQNFFFSLLHFSYIIIVYFEYLQLVTVKQISKLG